MNWNKIKEKFPKAWNKYIDYSSIAAFLKDGDLHLMEGGVFSINDIRELYDFFESQYVICSIWKNINVLDPMTKTLCTISIDYIEKSKSITEMYFENERWHHESMISSMPSIEIRGTVKAESILFSYAFKILESQLNAT